MKKLIAVAACLVTCSTVYAGGKGYGKGAPVYVAPHVTKSGSYVQGSMRTAPNSTRLDNYSTKGNVNPYTGKSGTKSPYKPVKP